MVQVCTRGGNRSFHTSKDFDPSSCDLLYVLTDDAERYLIPAACVRVRTALTLGPRLDRFRLGGTAR